MTAEDGKFRKRKPQKATKLLLLPATLYVQLRSTKLAPCEKGGSQSVSSEAEHLFYIQRAGISKFSPTTIDCELVN